ncbi:amino acid ABC transporter permease [Thioclava sp. GXIMD2076]|uniref:amino acid ABC transporter permease n=1 Tax=Thioclava sp. GXIMD2076 TaxID=3131931 RepID=UPI0030CE2BCB
MFDLSLLIPDFLSILPVVPWTLAMAVAVFVLSTLLGSLFALCEYRRIPVLRELVVAYKVVFKGVPMVVVIFLTYFGLPAALEFVTGLVGLKVNGHMTPNWVTLIVALTSCVAAFQTEVIKGALNSFDKGQAEAAHSLGYTGWQLFRRVLLPQVTVAAIPDLANSVMVIMKALSLGFAIEVVDIFAQAQLTAALNFYYLEAFLVAVVIYMVIAYLVTQLADFSERRLRLRS